MGCDIHCYVEYRPLDCANWLSFGKRINPGRDYNLFGYLAGVRSSRGPEYALRGFPKDAGYYATDDNFIFISDSDSEERHVSPERAKKWVESGTSYYTYYEDGTPRRVSNPDWHSHSWLTAREFSDVLQKAGSVGIEYKALEAAMKVLLEKGECRIVFWFDN